MTETEVDLVDEIIDAATDRGDFLLVTDLVVLIERHDPAVIESDEFGVSEDRLISYAEALPESEEFVSAEKVRKSLAEDTVESEGWVGQETLYVTGENHVSVYPRSWHEALAGEDDLVRFVEFIVAHVDDSKEAFDHGGQGPGVPQSELLNAATVLGSLTWTEARQEVERLRDEGVFAEDARQHPDARITLVDPDHR